MDENLIITYVDPKIFRNIFKVGDKIIKVNGYDVLTETRYKKLITEYYEAIQKILKLKPGIKYITVTTKIVTNNIENLTKK